MTREQVIKGLECHSDPVYGCDACPYSATDGDDDCGWLELCKDALALLKEQEVIPHQNYANLDMWWCECGWCLGMRETFNYCPNCGKAVKWE